MRTLIVYDSIFGNTDNGTVHQITQHIRYGFALALRDIAPFGRNFVYAGSVRRHGQGVRKDGIADRQ